MKKIEYAEILTKSIAWDGEKDPNKLVRMYTLQELKDLYAELAEAEEEYCDWYYQR